ncbi:DUF4158 domain-containing protein [Nonomuraea fuscirosea]|uniref:DUF4158 domain-containing protein n=1 Tax=Nonomuraea fuscirosea TaxID=1291556 RepID=UPI003718CB7C
MEKVFFLDDAGKALIAKRRGGHLKLGFALQLGTVRFLRTFLTDPLDVPTEVMDFVAEQLEIADPLCVKRYTEREKTRLDHTWEIRRVFGLRDFAEVEDELTAWVDARAWMFEEGRTAINEVPTPEQRQVLMMVPEIRPGMRMSDLERWRTGPARASGPEMVKTLKLVREICQAGFGKIELGTQMPRRRLAMP